jgi:hypothetical protein
LLSPIATFLAAGVPALMSGLVDAAAAWMAAWMDDGRPRLAAMTDWTVEVVVEFGCGVWLWCCGVENGRNECFFVTS